MRKTLCYVVLALSFASACASGEVDPDNGAGDTGNNAIVDANNDTSTMLTDTQPPQSDTSTPIPDTPTCGTCCAGETRCQDSRNLETCNAGGTAWTAAACADDVSCVAGACNGPELVCEPGSFRCLNAETQQSCNGQGTAFTTIPCGSGVCIGGTCRMGSKTSESCTDDAECAGGACFCDGGDDCPPAITAHTGTGYCTNADCLADICAPDEVCVDWSVTGLGQTGNHCLKNCANCSQAGFGCRSVPTRNGETVAWADACVPDYPRDVAEFCATGADCLGGVCWRGQPYPDNGYCATPACGDDYLCPSGSSCVDFADQGFVCLRHCGNGAPNSGPCPSGLGIDVSCQFLTEHTTADLKYICAPRL